MSLYWEDDFGWNDLWECLGASISGAELRSGTLRVCVPGGQGDIDELGGLPGHSIAEIIGPSRARLFNLLQVEAVIGDRGFIDACLAFLAAQASWRGEEGQGLAIEGECSPIKRLRAVQRMLSAPCCIRTICHGCTTTSSPLTVELIDRVPAAPAQQYGGKSEKTERAKQSCDRPSRGAVAGSSR